MFNVHIQNIAVVAHACHGHRYWFSPVPLSGTGEHARSEQAVIAHVCRGL